MRIRVVAGEGVPIYLQIVNQIKYLIASGRLSRGDQLPPVRKLAEQLVINPNTVARAYRELETAGALAPRQGAGVYVSDGGSPLAVKERKRILTERIDSLLTDAQHMNVDLEDVVKLLRQRNQKLEFKKR